MVLVVLDALLELLGEGGRGQPAMCCLSAKQIRGRSRILFAEKQIEIEEIATLTPLQNATELLRRDLKLGVRGDIAFWSVRPSSAQRALFRVHHELIVGEIKLDGSRRSERSNVGDRVSIDSEFVDPIRRLPGQRGFDQFTRLLFASIDD
jgi:hypothetical protein